MSKTNTIAFRAAATLSVAVLNLGFVLAVPAAAQAQTVQLQLSEKYSNATHDPSRIWTDKDLKPFGSNPGKRGADITEYGAPAADGSRWLLSQILSEDCSLQLCPARLAKIAPDGMPSILVDDMMHIGGPFMVDGGVLKNGDYQFPIGPSK
ncbi:MAG: hypothetical protein ACKVON_12630 [Beijerinckiaceae bacterium]